MAYRSPPNYGRGSGSGTRGRGVQPVNVCERDMTELAVHALGALDDEDRLTVEEHLAACQRCRTELDELSDVRDVLDMLPREAWLDGPPDGADLMLQRTLRAALAERSGRRLPGRLVAVAAAVVL